MRAVLARSKCGHLEWQWILAPGYEPAQRRSSCYDCRYSFSAMEWRFEWHWVHMGFKPPFGEELHRATSGLR